MGLFILGAIFGVVIGAAYVVYILRDVLRDIWALREFKKSEFDPRNYGSKTW